MGRNDQLEESDKRKSVERGQSRKLERQRLALDVGAVGRAQNIDVSSIRLPT
jgi:hypothetical protein